MRITIWRSLAANMTLLMRSFDLLGLEVAAPRHFSMNLKTEKSRLDLLYEAARIYLLKVNASHTKIRWSNDKTYIGLGWTKYRDLSLSRKLIIE